MSKQEHVILVNAQGEILGTQEKHAAHSTSTPLHLAFSCWLFNSHGEMLLTRRALSKKAWPGVWTNSVCGHPQLKETTEQAIVRRCRYEVGADLHDITSVYPEFSYRETDSSGIVESEICPVFAARVTNELTLNREEVMEAKWLRLDNLRKAVEAAPFLFSPWLVLQLNHIPAREKLQRFAQTQ
ncbi:MAG TPA: isopentenyl-diphosphate Delta-isomerase [Scandinavium sp.]|jgi:isopentenyl-diphosphate delta-isomerase